MTFDPARLRALIEGRGLTIKDVATDAHMSRQAVHQIVSGAVANPGIRTVERIVAACGLSVADLYADED